MIRWLLTSDGWQNRAARLFNHHRLLNSLLLGVSGVDLSSDHVGGGDCLLCRRSPNLLHCALLLDQ